MFSAAAFLVMLYNIQNSYRVTFDSILNILHNISYCEFRSVPRLYIFGVTELNVSLIIRLCQRCGIQVIAVLWSTYVLHGRIRF